MSIEEECAAMYKYLGEKVGNTNLPRNLTQFKIEIDNLIEEKESRYDYFKRIEDLSDEVESKKLICDVFENKCKELEKTIEQQELSIKIYKDNDAEGLSEFCEKVNEDLEKLQVKYDELEEANEYNKEETINCRNALKDVLCECVRLSPDIADGCESIKLENLWYEKDYSELLVDVITEMNEDDWNEDDRMVQFNITVLDGGSHGQKVVRIELDLYMDPDDE